MEGRVKKYLPQSLISLSFSFLDSALARLLLRRCFFSIWRMAVKFASRWRWLYNALNGLLIEPVHRYAKSTKINTWLDSSVAERPAVNRMVISSNLIRASIRPSTVK